MKFIKGFILTVALTLSFSVFAKSQEEVCYNTVEVEVEVELKRAFNSHPDQFNIYIDLLEKHKVASDIKKRIRESAYWIYNRKNLSDEDFRRLSFLRCLVYTSK